MRTCLFFLLITIFRVSSTIDDTRKKDGNDELSENTTTSILPILRSLTNNVGNHLDNLVDDLSEHFAQINKDVILAGRVLRYFISPLNTSPFSSTLEPIPGILAGRVKAILNITRLQLIDDKMFEKKFEMSLRAIEYKLDVFSTFLQQEVTDQRANTPSASLSESRHRRNDELIRFASRVFTNAYEKTAQSMENDVIERNRNWNGHIGEFVAAIEDVVYDIDQCSGLCWRDELDKKHKLDEMLRIAYTLKGKTEYQLNSFEAAVKGRLNEMKFFVDCAVSQLFRNDRIFTEVYFPARSYLQVFITRLTNIPIDPVANAASLTEIVSAVNVTAAAEVRSTENATSTPEILSTGNATSKEEIPTSSWNIKETVSTENVTSKEEIPSVSWNVQETVSTENATSADKIVPMTNFTATEEAASTKSVASVTEVIFAKNTTSATELTSALTSEPKSFKFLDEIAEYPDIPDDLDTTDNHDLIGEFEGTEY